MPVKVIIVGAGDVGLASAQAAKEENDVLVIDRDPARAENAKNTLQVSVLREDGSNPRVIKEAIERMDADIIIAAVADDAVCLFICIEAKRDKPDIRTVACVRNPDFMNGNPAADVILSPTDIAAEKIIRMTYMENAVAFNKLSGDRCMTTFRIDSGMKAAGKTVMDTAMPAGCTVMAIHRGDRVITDVDTAELRPGDRICVLGNLDSMDQLNEALGVTKEAREVVILGAGNMAIRVARALLSMEEKFFIKIIDSDITACRNAAKLLKEAIVVNGNPVDPVFLKSENVDRADVLISVDDRDERNLLAGLTALRFGISKIISIYSLEEYDSIFRYAGIESVVGFRRVISNEIYRAMRVVLEGKDTGYIKMEMAGDYLLRINITRDMPICGMYAGDAVYPEGVRLAALLRGDRMIFPKLTEVVSAGDTAVLFVHNPNALKLSRLFGNKVTEP
ncbi:MAG: NAD-binding protein [Methanomethylophilus sp.]